MIESLCLYLLCLSAALLCYIGFQTIIDSIQNLFLLYLLLWLCDFTIKNLQDFIKIYRALIKDIFPVAEANPENHSNRL